MQYGEDEKYLKLVTVTKHYADYDQEGNFGVGRTSFDANVSMLSFHSKHYKSVVQYPSSKRCQARSSGILLATVENSHSSCEDTGYHVQLQCSQWHPLLWE